MNDANESRITFLVSRAKDERNAGGWSHALVMCTARSASYIAGVVGRSHSEWLSGSFTEKGYILPQAVCRNFDCLTCLQSIASHK